MNRAIFAIICAICALGAAVTVVLRTMGVISERDFFAALVMAVALLPALAWLRLRFERRRQQRQAEFDRYVSEANQMLAPRDAQATTGVRNRRRQFVSVGLLAVGLCLALAAPERVLKGTHVQVGWLIAAVGGILLGAELMGMNIFRGTPLDRRLDPRQTQRERNVDRDASHSRE